MTFISSLEGRRGGGGRAGGESPTVLRPQRCIPSLSSDLWLKYRDFTSARKKCLQQRKRRKRGEMSKTASAQLSHELRLFSSSAAPACCSVCLRWEIRWYMYAWETHAWRSQHLCGSVQEGKLSCHNTQKNSLQETEMKWNQMDNGFIFSVFEIELHRIPPVMLQNCIYQFNKHQSHLGRAVNVCMHACCS